MKTWTALKQSYLFWIGIALAACGVVIGVLGSYYKHLDERFTREGVSAEGTILIKKREDNTDRDPRYLVQFGFTDSQQKSVTAWQALPESMWNGLAANQTLPISYLRSEPATARIASPETRQDGRIQILLAEWGLALGILCIAGAIIARKPKPGAQFGIEQ